MADRNLTVSAKSNISVRNIDESVMRKLRMRAASEGRSLEEEIRRILEEPGRQRYIALFERLG